MTVARYIFLVLQKYKPSLTVLSTVSSDGPLALFPCRITNVAGRVVAVGGYDKNDYWLDLEEFQPHLDR